jgi:hypothetical protein
MAKEPGLSDLTEMSGKWLLNVWEMLMFKRNGRDPFFKMSEMDIFPGETNHPVSWLGLDGKWMKFYSQFKSTTLHIKS